METASLSIGVMAPTLAMSVTGVAAAAVLGRAAPLAFAVAAVGVGLVAYGFIRLAGEFSHAGSVYAFVGNTLGPRPGFLAGWALLGTYLVFAPVSIMGVAVFGRAFLDTTGLAHDADWYPLALAAWAVIWVLAARGVRPTTRSLLAFEVVSVCLHPGAHGRDLLASDRRDGTCRPEPCPARPSCSRPAWALPPWRWPRRQAFWRSLALSRRARWARSPSCRRG